MAVKFSLPLESADNYPSPSVLATPKFRLHHLSLSCQIKNDSQCIYTKNGRGAFGIAGQLLKRQEKNTILIPAYHCPALVEPFIWAGYEIVFYHIDEKLNTDLAELEKYITEHQATHCVLIHFFGFNLNLNQSKAILKKHNITVIEDCAHAFFTFCDNLHNDDFDSEAQICSINKLLPSIDGGALYMPNATLPSLNRRNWLKELKGLLHTFGISQRLLKLKPRKRQAEDASPNQGNSIDSPYRYFVPGEVFDAGYRHTVVMAKYSNMSAIKKARRDNYQYMVSKLRDCSAGEPLIAELEDNEVPYVLPFLLKHGEDFSVLRKAGIQVLRWEEIAESNCKASQIFHERLVQLPCHHQLSKDQIEHVVQTVNALR